jgi:hypothetical protein
VAVRPNRLPQQPILPFLTGRTDTARPLGHLAIVVAGRTMPVVIARHRRARRYVLRMAPDEQLRLTVPREPRSAPASALRNGNATGSCGRARACAIARAPGIAAPSSGTGTRRARGDRARMSATFDAGQKRCGCPRPDADVRVAIEAWWRAAAERELIVRTQELASALAPVSRASPSAISDSRWGACLSSRCESR